MLHKRGLQVGLFQTFLLMVRLVTCGVLYLCNFRGRNEETRFPNPVLGMQD